MSRRDPEDIERLNEIRREARDPEVVIRTYIVVGARKIAGKGKGEEVELPEGQGERLIRAGHVAEKPAEAPIPVIEADETQTVAEPEKAAPSGPQVPRPVRKGNSRG